MHSLIMTNFAFVLFFGITLTLSFAGIEPQKNIRHYAAVYLSFGIIQMLIYVFFGPDFLFKSYPLFTHLPLFLLLRYYYKRNPYIAGIAVLSAYLFCTPRKWIGTAVSFFMNYDPGVSYMVQILITIPLLAVIIRFISPYVARLNYESNKILRLFISVPLIYYAMEYTLTVYTKLLYEGGDAIVEFMDAALVIVYFVFSVIYLKTLYEKKEVEVEQALFKVLADQSKAEIEALRKSQKQAAIYRHDLKHHMNYLNGCIAENNLKGALSYISEVCKEIDSADVIRYSENESVNLILSAYAAKAKEKKINCGISISAEDFRKLAVPDLCSLLSNALENAINACKDITNKDKRFIRLRIYSKNNKLCIDIRNSCHTEPEFKHGLPLSKEQGHGFGTKSMAHVAEKYKGVYQFSIVDGIFIFQATI